MPPSVPRPIALQVMWHATGSLRRFPCRGGMLLLVRRLNPVAGGAQGLQVTRAVTPTILKGCDVVHVEQAVDSSSFHNRAQLNPAPPRWVIGKRSAHVVLALQEKVNQGLRRCCPPATGSNGTRILARPQNRALIRCVYPQFIFGGCCWASRELRINVTCQIGLRKCGCAGMVGRAVLVRRNGALKCCMRGLTAARVSAPAGAPAAGGSS